MAAPITPCFDTFGSLSGATFGGSGIPNDAVAITTLTQGTDIITLGLAATQRFSNPALSNDGAGTFQALPGSDPGGTAFWNFSFYVDIQGTGTTNDYQFDLFYDFDPAADTDRSLLGKIDLTASVAASFPSGLSLLEGSQNLGFGFLATTTPPLLTSPVFPAFDPSAEGEYSFALTASDLNGGEIGRSAINVNVVPEPASLALMGAGIFGLGFVRRRKQNASLS